MTTKDDLLDEIRTFQRSSKRGGPVCAMKQALLSVDNDDRVALEEALADPTIFGTAIASVLKNRGMRVSSYAVNRHRRGGCACD